MKNLGNFGNVAVALTAVLGIPRLAGALTTLVAENFGASLDRIDPDGAFVWGALHHFWQLLLTIGAMLILNRPLRMWGFNLSHRDRSLSLVWRFGLYLTGFVLAGHVLLYFIAPPPVFSHPLTTRNIMGELTFKLLLSGTAEEPLFRGLVMCLLYQSMAGSVRVSKIEMPHAGLVAAVLFTVAHIGFSVWPFAITWLSVPQLLQAFALGLFDAFLFHQTRSLLAPVLAHNYFNFLLTATGVAWALMGKR